MSDITPNAPSVPRSHGSGLTAKMGPLPVWGWGALVGGLVLVYLYTRKGKSGSGLTAEPSATAAYPNVSAVPIQGGSGATTATGSTGVPDTNSSWLQQGIKQANDLGYTPLDAETALRNYLNGTPLTPDQAKIVNAVETAQGSAPQGLGGTPSVVTPQPAAQPSALDQAKASIGGNERRNTIIDYYSQILGRIPGRYEVNAWDSTGQSLPQIYSGITNSQEAKVTTR